MFPKAVNDFWQTILVHNIYVNAPMKQFGIILNEIRDIIINQIGSDLLMLVKKIGKSQT